MNGLALDRLPCNSVLGTYSKICQPNRILVKIIWRENQIIYFGTTSIPFPANCVLWDNTRNRTETETQRSSYKSKYNMNPRIWSLVIQEKYTYVDWLAVRVTRTEEWPNEFPVITICLALFYVWKFLRNNKQPVLIIKPTICANYSNLFLE